MQYSQENACASRWKPSFTEHQRWLLLDFRGSKCLFQLNLVFITDSHTGVCSELFRKQPLKLLCKKSCFHKFCSFTGKQLCWSPVFIELQTFRPAALLKRDSNTDILLWNLQNFLRTFNLKSAYASFWNLFFHLDCPF